MKCEAAFLETVAFIQYSFGSTLDPTFRFWFFVFQNGRKRELFHICFKNDREGIDFILILASQLITFSQHIAHNSFFIAHNSQQLSHGSQLNQMTCSMIKNNNCT